MNGQHSPEPWQQADSDAGYIHDANGLEVASCTIYDDDEFIVNAKRIVACVNFCRGIPTEKLERCIEVDSNSPHFVYVAMCAGPPMKKPTDPLKNPRIAACLRACRPLTTEFLEEHAPNGFDAVSLEIAKQFVPRRKLEIKQ